MTDQSVFNDTNPATPPLDATQGQPNAYEDLLKTIVNEQGQPKYANINEALKALQHAQSYIPEVKNQLTAREQEVLRLQAELEQRQSIEDVVSRLAKPNQPDVRDDQSRTSGLDESAVMKLVQETLERQAQLSAAQANQAQVEQALKAKFGDKTADVVKQRASELGLTPKALGELSSKSPQAVLALFNTQGTHSPQPTRSSVNIPPTLSPSAPPLERPAKSLLTGASTKEQMEYMAKIRQRVYDENGIS
ncbi:hypothetical protein D3C87_1076450 [compost metagenome]